MDVLGWLWWLLASFIGLVWSIAWFLLGGWVSTLAQIAIVLLIVFGFKYGWRRAPLELMARLATFGRFAWAWLRARDLPATPPSAPQRRRSGPRGRYFDRRQPGDIRLNVSTCLSLLMLAELVMLAMM